MSLGSQTTPNPFAFLVHENSARSDGFVGIREGVVFPDRLPSVAHLEQPNTSRSGEGSRARKGHAFSDADEAIGAGGISWTRNANQFRSIAT